MNLKYMNVPKTPPVTCAGSAISMELLKKEAVPQCILKSIRI